MGLKDVVAENFKVCRGDKTQREHAENLGVALRVYQNWEGGTSIPELPIKDTRQKKRMKSAKAAKLARKAQPARTHHRLGTTTHPSCPET